MKKGLVLEGGAMKGMFTCGVIDVFMENGISFDGAIGVSAGAVFGCNLKSRQIGRAIRYNKRFAKDKRYASFKNLVRTGDLYGAKFCYEELPYKLDIWDESAYKDNSLEFVVVTSDLETGKPDYHVCPNGDAKDIKWFRASASMPFVSKAVEIDGKKLLDGGMTDSIPLKYFEERGYEKIVVVQTKPKDYRKSKSSAMAIMAKIFYRKYPRFVKAVADRYLMYNEQMDYLGAKEAKKEVLVIRPPKLLKVKPIERDEAVLEEIYQLGRSEAKKMLPAVKDFLAE